MNNFSIITYINKPELLDENTLPQIKLLLLEFPYFQTLHLLLLRNLENLNLNNEYTEKLKESALYIGDRKKLFLFLNKKIDQSKDNQTNIDTEDVINSTQEEINSTYKEELILIDELQNIDIYSEYTNQFSDTLTDTTKDKDLLILEGYLEEEELKEVTEIINSKKDNNISIVYPAEYLLKETKNLSSEKKDNELKLSDINLIDKFIKTKPRIVPDKNNTSENIDISIESAKENDNFITERLAEIYLNQKLYSKAIYSYEKLCLKFPKKSTYFEAKIKDIKKLTNKY